MTVEVHSTVTGNGAGSPPANGFPAATNGRVARRSYARIPTVLEAPHLVQIQLDSFREFKEEGLEELFTEISPIQDYNQKSMDLSFEQVEFDEPRATVELCRERDMTYAAPLYVKARLLVKETGEIKESRVYLGEFPMMTDDGTFIINGAERVVVSQLVRSPGVYFTAAEDPSSGRKLFAAKLIPNRGAWLEFETSNKDVLSVKVDRKRKMPVTILLRAIGYGTDEEILQLFADVDTNPDRQYIKTTLEKEPTKSTDQAIIELYHRLRPGDTPT
jgi:DNA-directed RNA polymerase subunit beta